MVLNGIKGNFDILTVFDSIHSSEVVIVVLKDCNKIFSYQFISTLMIPSHLELSSYFVNLRGLMTFMQI